MLSARLIGSNIHITSSDARLLKIKQEIKELIPPGLIRPCNRNEISIPASIAYLITRILIKYQCDIDDSITSGAESQEEKYRLHTDARSQIIQIHEESVCRTCDPYWDTLLKPHQGIAVNSMLTPGLIGMCIFDEQGTGKTLPTIATYDILKNRGEIDVMVIVAPKTVLSSWKKEFDDFLPNKYTLLEVDSFGALLENKDVYLLNYEKIANNLTILIAKAKSTRIALVVDESYFIKNPAAKRTRAIMELRSFCNKSYVLCGTPAPNNPNDIVSQFDLSDGGYTFFGFNPSGESHRDRDEILNRIMQRGIYIRRTKDEVLPDLPSKRYVIEQLQMKPLQKLLYERAKSELVLFLKKLDNTTFRKHLSTYFQKRAALLQICTIPQSIDPTYKETHTKLHWLDELLSELISVQNKKVVLWTVYTRSLDELEKRYVRYGISRIDGTITSSIDRMRMIDQFQKNPGIKLFIGNPAAAGAGITLTAAEECIFFSLSNQAAHYLQSVDRIHRIGQLAEEVVYRFLICRRTIEEKEIKLIANKEKGQKDLLGDIDEGKVTLDTALEELEEPCAL